MRATNPNLLKLLALPLSQPKSTTHPPPFLLHAVRQSLQTASADAKRQDQPAVTRYTHKAIDKAADLWAGLGKADEGTWKRRAYVSWRVKTVNVLDGAVLSLRRRDC